MADQTSPKAVPIPVYGKSRFDLGKQASYRYAASEACDWIIVQMGSRKYVAATATDRKLGLLGQDVAA